MALAIVGDIHGNYNGMDRIVGDVQSSRPDVVAIIQVGDFGWYPFFRPYWNLLKPEIPIYWIDGNHEYFPDIPLSADKPVEVAPNIFYVPRGCILELDNRRLACMGGAASVDKAWRTSGKDWFVEENISPAEVLKLDVSKPVDFFISHTPPQSMIEKHFNPLDLRYFDLSPSWRDPNAQVIEGIWKSLGYPSLFCGHMHRSVVDGNCRILNVEEVFYV